MRQAASTKERSTHGAAAGKGEAGAKGETGSGRAASGSQTLLRGLDVLEGVAQGATTLAQLAGQLGLTRSTTHRLANALVERRYLTLVPGRGYQLGPKLLELGYRAQKQADIVAVAQPILTGLSGRTGLPSFLGARDGDCSVTLLAVAGTQRVAVTTPVGTRRKLAETSLGKALLLDGGEAEWERHFAAADQDCVPADWREAMRASVASGVVIHAGPPPDHVRAVAAPVRDAAGMIVGGISAVTIAQYMDLDAVAQLAPQLREAAAAIGAGLGHREAPAPSGRS